MKTYENESLYLCHLLASVIDDTQPDEKPEAFTFEQIYAIAKKHSVANIAFYAVEKLKKKPENTLYQKWSQTRDMAILRDLTQQEEWKKIRHAFEKNHIAYIPLKGIVLKNDYPQSDMRMMGDIDVLIHEEDAKKAKDIMIELGYQCEEYDRGHHDVYYKKPLMNIEIHRALFGQNMEIYRRFFSNCWEYASPLSETSYFNTMSNEYFFVFLVAHLDKHYHSLNGTGLRSFLDFYVYLRKYQKTLNWSVINALIKQLNLTDRYTNYQSVINILYANKPINKESLLMISHITGCGTYGNFDVMIENELRYQSKLHYIFRQLFPKYKDMSEHYPIIRKNVFLIPVCYLYRLFIRPFVSWKKTIGKIKALVR